MLHQEINLYKHFEAPKSEGDFLTWKRYLFFNLIIFIILCLIYVSSWIEYIYLKHRNNNLQAEMAIQEKQFNQYKSKLPQIFFQQDINDVIKSMKSELDAQKKIIEILGKNVSFSKVLIELSSTIIPDVWLTKISIEKNGSQIMLHGNTSGTLIDEYLDQIGKDKFFSNYTIKLNQVKNETPTKADTNANLKFEILLEKR